MRIVLVTQWYPPEQAPIGYMFQELAKDLLQKGHDVTIVTGFPNHPTGIVYSGYEKKWRQLEIQDGIKLRRVYLYTSAARSKLNRMITFASFTITSTIELLFLKNVDLIFAVFQPLSVGLTLPVVAKLKNTKLVLNIQDLHPDVQIELGLVRSPWVIKFLKWVEKFGYNSADGLVVICDYFKKHSVKLGAHAESVKVIPNWIDLNEIVTKSRENCFRETLGLSAEHIVILYAGTMGMVSGAGIVLAVAEKLQHKLPNLRFVFVGEGPLVSDMKVSAIEKCLANVTFYPFQKRELLSDVQAASDISIVTLLRGKGKASVPSKVLGYMAAARPVIASVESDSETAHLIRDSKCGEVVEPEDVEQLCLAITKLANSLDLRMEMGIQGRLYLEQNYQRNKVTSQYIDFFESLETNHDL
jgi:colanic acid biosynthesis glycosyl transferase WcaI